MGMAAASTLKPGGLDRAENEGAPPFSTSRTAAGYRFFTWAIRAVRILA